MARADIGGVLLGKYRIEDRLSHGGPAEVFRVNHQELGDTRVIKVLFRSAAGVSVRE